MKDIEDYLKSVHRANELIGEHNALKHDEAAANKMIESFNKLKDNMDIVGYLCVKIELGIEGEMMRVMRVPVSVDFAESLINILLLNLKNRMASLMKQSKEELEKASSTLVVPNIGPEVKLKASEPS